MYVWLALSAGYDSDQPGMVANPARGQLNREKNVSPAPVRAWEFGLARRVRPSCPVPRQPAHSPHSGWMNLTLLTGFLPISATASTYTANRHRAGPKFIGSRNCVPMAFTAESPSAQGQCGPQGSSRCLFRFHHGPIFYASFFPPPLLYVNLWYTKFRRQCVDCSL